MSTKSEHVVKAGAGIEPANSGFADRDLTTWLPRQFREDERNVGAQRVNAAKRFVPANVIRDR